MSRLTARTETGHAYLVNVKPDEQEVNSPHKNTLQCILDCFERLAQYEDAEEQGRCVVLPCKVGTRVWVIGRNCDLCRDMYAEEPCLFGSCEYKEVFESVFGYGMIDNFGKTVFLTRTEAEGALQKEAQHERD
jgi:hypothetical protein